MTEPMPTFRLRRGTADDSRRAFDVFLPSAQDLTRRLNVPWDVEAESLWERMRSLWDRLAEHHAEWWIAEDPATGSAAAILAGPLASAADLPDGTHTWEIAQGEDMGRPSRITLTLDSAGGRPRTIRVGGHAVAVARGELLA